MKLKFLMRKVRWSGFMPFHEAKMTHFIFYGVWLEIKFSFAYKN